MIGKASSMARLAPAKVIPSTLWIWWTQSGLILEKYPSYPCSLCSTFSYEEVGLLFIIAQACPILFQPHGL